MQQMIDDCSGCDKVNSIVFLTEVDEKGDAILLCDKCLKDKEAIQKRLKQPSKKISLRKFKWLEVA
jgi:hypothetical protein